MIRGVDLENGEVQQHIDLPNHFNTIAEISFDVLEKNQHVIVTVNDLLGRRLSIET